MSTAANRQVNIYVNSGDAEKAFERLTNQNTKLNKAVSKNTDEISKLEKELSSFSGAKSSEEYKKLKQNVDLKRAAVEKDTQTMKTNADEMSRLQRKINGELSPSYNDLAKRVATLTRELKNMSREDGGWKEKIEQLRKAKTEMDSMGQSMNKTNQNYSSAFGGAKSVAIGTLAANAAMQFVDRFKEELTQGIQDAKVFEGIKEAFDRLNSPNLLDEMRKAVKGTVNDLEIMKLAVQANNFEIPLNKLATLFEFAKKRAQDTGQEVDFLVQSIVTGIGRKSPLILDNLGISAVRLRQELKGVAAESATIGDVAEAVGRVIEEESAKAGKVTDTYSAKIARNKAEWENLRREIADRILPIWAKLSEAFYGTMSVLGKVGMAFANFFSVKEEGVKIGIKTVFQQKEEAASAQRLLSRYEELKEKGIKATSKEKTEMTSITYQLKSALGDSVVAIDKETGALNLNTAAVEKAIKQKILLSNAELSKVALEYNNAKQEKAMAEAELERINAARKQKGDALMGDIKDAQTRAQILREDQSKYLELQPLREGAITQANKMAEANKTLLSTEKDLAKYGFKVNDFDFEKLAANVEKPVSKGGAGGDKPEGDSKLDDQIKKQKDFIERMKDIRRDYEISDATQDEKEIEAVRVKYAKMVDELDKAFPKMTSQAKAYRDEIYLMQIGALAAVMDKQEYAHKLKASDDYFKELQSKYKEAYANGDIDKKEYDRLIEQSDIALKNKRVEISTEFSSKNKQAEQDRVKHAEDANNSIQDIKIKESDYLKKLLQEDLLLDEEIDYLLEVRAEKMKKRKVELIAEYVGMGAQLLQGFFALSATDYSADLNREQRTNDKKKQEYKRMLDSKRISQAKYNQLVEKADEETAKKQNEIKRKQFEGDKAARKMSIVADIATGIMRAIATAGPIWAQIAASAFVTAQGTMQLAAVDRTKYQEMKYGGILNGPSHSQGGLKLYNPQTGLIEAELEGGEAHMVLSKAFTENNADIIPGLLAASRTGAKLFDILPAFSSGIPRVNAASMIDTVRMATGGILAPQATQSSTTSITKNDIESTSRIDLMALSAINDNLITIADLLNSKFMPLNYDILAKEIAEKFKKYAVIK